MGSFASLASGLHHVFWTPGLRLQHTCGRCTLHIVVCTKHVPDSGAKMSLDEAGTVSWGESPLIVNPWDEYAVEEALTLRDQHGGKVTVISMGLDAALEALKHAPESRTFSHQQSVVGQAVCVIIAFCPTPTLRDNELSHG